jgi:hypothetical protein
MASEWIPIIFEDNITDMVYHIAAHWANTVFDKAEERISHDFSYEDWSELSRTDRCGYASEALDIEFEKFTDDPEDTQLLSVYWNEIVEYFVDNM